jgi:hypothetical protein
MAVWGWPRAWANGERLGHGHAMRWAGRNFKLKRTTGMGSFTQPENDAQQQSMGQGRLHGGCDVRSTGAAWTVYSSWPWGLGVLGFPNNVIPTRQHMMFSVTHGGAGPSESLCLRNLLCR